MTYDPSGHPISAANISEIAVLIVCGLLLEVLIDGYATGTCGATINAPPERGTTLYDDRKSRKLSLDCTFLYRTLGEVRTFRSQRLCLLLSGTRKTRYDASTEEHAV